MWIHCGSTMALANRSMRSWPTWNQGETPTSGPTCRCNWVMSFIGGHSAMKRSAPRRCDCAAGQAPAECIHPVCANLVHIQGRSQGSAGLQQLHDFAMVAPPRNIQGGIAGTVAQGPLGALVQQQPCNGFVPGVHSPVKCAVALRIHRVDVAAPR